MSTLSLKQLLPMDQDKRTKNAQGRIPISLYETAEAIIDKHNWNWSQVMRALFEKFVSDFEETPKPQGPFKLKQMTFDESANRSAWK